jgi:hypothetical protein
MQEPTPPSESAEELVRLLTELRDIARQQLDLSRSSVASYERFRETYTAIARRAFRLVGFIVVIIALALAALIIVGLMP